MELNSDGKLAKFYIWASDDNELPQDFCTYFWGLVFRAFMIFGVGSLMLFSLVGGIVIFLMWLTRLVWAHKTATLVSAVVLLIVSLLVWLSERKEKIKIEVLSEAKLIITTKIDAVKNRYCPRITWK